MTLPAESDTALPSPNLRAALWMLGAVTSFMTMAIAGRALSAELDTFEIMTMRSLTGMVVVIGYVTLARKWAQISTHRIGLHALRNALHFGGQNLWFYAITVVPLAQVFALEFTAPLWVLVLSPFLLGERMTRRRALAGVAGFAGVMIITQPGTQAISPGLLAAAGCSVSFALTMVATKLLTRDVPTVGILFWLTTLQALFGLICAGYDGDFTLPSIALWPAAIVVGLTGLIAHLCITTALSIAPASVVSPMDFLRLPTAAVIGLLMYNEPLDPFVLLGAVIIFGANYVNIRGSSRA